jgi:precorrin-2/cobalt-factor-2 C20-methyltransferase
MTAGTLHALGMGPGDPELVTLKAARILAAAPVVAFFAKRGRPGHARAIAAPLLPAGVEELRLDYPFTTEIALADPRYLAGIGAFYDECAGRIAARLAAGRDVALLCEGDPFFYGSAMYIFDRIGRDFASAVIPGVTGMSGCWARVGVPMLHGDDVLTVLPGTLDEDTLVRRLANTDAAVVMKLGRNLGKVRHAITRAGLLDRAIYAERGTMADETFLALRDRPSDAAPYFSLILIPGRQRRR